MGVTIDKSRGNTIAEGVSIKSVTEGGSAALARSPRGVGLKLGMHLLCMSYIPLIPAIKKLRNNRHRVGHLKQGSYRSWKIWKVMEFYKFIFQAWKVTEFECGSWKVMDSD